MSILTIAFALFIIMDPIGNTPVFISMLKGYDIERQQRIIIREHLISLFLLVSCNFVGEAVLRMLHVSQASVYITSGVILFLIALRMIFPHIGPRKVTVPAPDDEPFITPLAVPLISGPSVMATIMLYSGQASDMEMVGAIFIAWIVSLSILVCSPYIQKAVGPKGLIAVERLMGMILTLISIERFLVGTKLFIHSL